MAAFHDQIRTLALDFETGINQTLDDDGIDRLAVAGYYTEDGVTKVNSLEVAVEYCRVSRYKNPDETPEKAKQIDLRIAHLQSLLLTRSPDYVITVGMPRRSPDPSRPSDSGRGGRRPDSP